MATSSTTRIDRSTQLISTTSLVYIRPITINVVATLLKPNTKMYAFFDGVSVSNLITPLGGAEGDQLITDVNGAISASFRVPSMTFTVGEKELLLIDYENYSVVGTLGTAVVRAKATFSSTGTLQTYQTTETFVTITTTTEEVPTENYDPLAQSFFTYGVVGGCFLTSIDLYFLSKDSTLPVWVEIREMVAGYPGPKITGAGAKCIKNASDVLLSTDGTTPTNFKFDKLVYLSQDKDYCFIVRSNSSKYNLFTSKLGETSLETGKVVFEQPYMGSMFKSENNITWTAEQTEDIKFTLYKASFNTGVESYLEVAIQPSSITIDSYVFQTVRSTDKILVTFPFKHGLRVDSNFAISVDTTGTYNGISGSLLTGNFSVTTVIDDYMFAFQVPTAVATSTGPIRTGGLIKEIEVNAGGSGYVSGDAVVITGSGTSAAATCNVDTNGTIISVKISNPGINYFGLITLSVTSVAGVGAVLTAHTGSKFSIITNRVYHSLLPQFSYDKPQDADITAKLDTTTSYFDNGGLTHYGQGKEYNVNIDNINYFDSNLLLASRFNEVSKMSSNYSALLKLRLKSSNPNVSPVINIDDSKVMLRTNSINNQKEENVNSVNSSGYVLSGAAGITLVNPGLGYTVAPAVTITGTGTGATATCTISGGIVNAVTVTNGGTGYYGTAKVLFDVGTSSSRATGVVNLSDYNSELKSARGTALTRYVTKPQTLQSVSVGVRVFVTAFSNTDSSFEVYIKRSLSSKNLIHDQQEWKLLTCDVDRNKSQNTSQFLEYEFYDDDLGQYDIYSIKFVLRTMTPWQPPIINNYRVIVLA